MQLRHEVKYFISYGEYLVLRDKLMAAMPMDEHSVKQSRGYHISSLYFDDINNSAMWEKMDGVQDRQKYRIRIYNLKDSPIHLENKMKFSQMTAKASCALSVEQGLAYKIAFNNYSIEYIINITDKLTSGNEMRHYIHLASRLFPLKESYKLDLTVYTLSK